MTVPSYIFGKISLLRNAISYRRFLLKKRIFDSASEEYALIARKYISPQTLFRLKSGNLLLSELLGKPIRVTDSFWYLHSLKEIFIEEVYRFKSSTDTPYILDCGSNIGLSVIYFKKLFPKAEIIAFEPDRHIYGLLKDNLHDFGYTDVVVENKAVWCDETILSFSSTGSLGGKLNDDKHGMETNENTFKVSTVRLKNYLNRKIDFLKMDIEGPEVEVLEDCGDLLSNVDNLFVEYHSDPAKEQQLENLLHTLRKAGFRVYIKEAWNNLPYPFLRKEFTPFYDLQLNIFAYRI